MKKLTTSVLILLSLLWAVSCGPTLSTTKMTNNDLGNYKTFAYLPNTNFEVPDNLDGQRSRVAKSIIDAMDKNMEDKGYKLDRKNPDLLVLLTTTYNKELMRDVDAVYATYPYNTTYPVSPYYENNYYWDYATYNEFVGYDVDYSDYKVGTLIVDIIDRKTKNKLWTGTAEQAIYQMNTSAAVAEYVDDIFDEYPDVSSK